MDVLAWLVEYVDEHGCYDQTGGGRRTDRFRWRDIDACAAYLTSTGHYKTEVNCRGHWKSIGDVEHCYEYYRLSRVE
jgi:hypothetical protein